MHFPFGLWAGLADWTWLLQEVRCTGTRVKTGQSTKIRPRVNFIFLSVGGTISPRSDAALHVILATGTTSVAACALGWSCSRYTSALASSRGNSPGSAS